MRSLPRVRAAGVAAVAVSIAGCTTAIGLSDYTFRADGTDAGAADAPSAAHPDRNGPPDASTGDAEAGAGASAGGADAADAASCSVDLATQCYPCAPATQPQFLNACTAASCVPFDDTRVTLLRDGGLPPLPARVQDAGTP